MSSGPNSFDVVVIGCGAAGLAAALTAAEGGARVAVLERADRQHRGGSTRWTGAYLRLEDPYTVAPGFVEDMMAFSGGRSVETYIRTLVELVPETMDWVQQQGVRIRKQPTIFITRSKPRQLPVGGGEQIVEKLAERAEQRGVEFRYETTALDLVADADGGVGGVRTRARDGRITDISATSVVIAAGGFEGNPEMLVQYLGKDADQLQNISQGGTFNKGEGIRMALGWGAKPSGEFGSFHAEPIDPRSDNPEAVVMIYPYGILVNSAGRRFVDEGSGTADETYEHVAREIWSQPGHRAYLITDQQALQVPNRDHAVLTEKKPVVAHSVEELAERLGLPVVALRSTLESDNADAGSGPFTPGELDGCATTVSQPPKSNWAYPLVSPPFLACPMSCAIVFTYGGIATNTSAEVVSSDDIPIPALFAAGECTGLYYGKYPGATSVLRSLAFGRVAGRDAAMRAVAQPVEIAR
jgi:tricarballylate dehydrogenase